MRKFTLCLLLLALGCKTAPPSSEEQERETARDFENLVLIVIDTLRSDHLPTYGYERDTAPFLIGLAREGIQLQGYSVSSWTRSSMATLFTGLYPQRHQTVNRDDYLPSTVPFLPEILASHDFSTFGYVANPNVGSEFGFNRGYGFFKEFTTSAMHRASLVIGDTLQATSELRDPFYLYVHLLDPHAPYAPNSPWGGEEENAEDILQPETVVMEKMAVTEDMVTRFKDRYDGEILATDRALRSLLSSLDQEQLEKTLVVVTSDHGEELGDHGGLLHGFTLYEEVLRVPLIFWNPALPPRRSQAGFHQIDFLPTVLDALGVPAPADIDGQSRWAEIRDGSYATPEELLFHLELDGSYALALRHSSYKLIERKTQPEPLIYDLESSAAEDDVARLPEDTHRQLRGRLRDLNQALLARRHRRVSASELSQQVREQLEDLGYLGRNDRPGAAPRPRGGGAPRDASEVRPPRIFADGFESGSTRSWASGKGDTP